VTHDKYGLGVILGVEDDAVLVDADPCQRSWVPPLVLPLLVVVMTIRTLRQLSPRAGTVV
jgi:hypothetical protein